MDTKEEKLIEEYRAYAASNGFLLNPNEKAVKMLVQALLKNEGKFGRKYCPCRKVHNNESVCPCIYHKDEIKDKGHCHCFLFVRKDG
jgi:ferredoxin-thioredoxin reductase catalytic chain